MAKSNGAHAIYVNSTHQKTGDKNTMLREARALSRSKASGSVTVWLLDVEGKRIGKPIWKSQNGVVRIKP